jgi:hypothetical protein
MQGLPRTIAALFLAIAAASAPWAQGAEAPATVPPTVPAAPPTVPAVPPNDPAVQAQMAGCAVWTDRCVTCQRVAGAVTCSNIGISCQPQALACLRPEPAEAKTDEKKTEERKPGN